VVIRVIVKCVSIPDRKKPNNYILKIVEPEKLKGKIAFPIDFNPAPDREYVCEIVQEAERWCRVKLHKCSFEKVKEWFEVETLECSYGYQLTKYVKMKCSKCSESKIEKYVIKEVRFKEKEVLPYLTGEEDIESLIKFVNFVEEFAKENNVNVKYLDSVKSWLPTVQKILKLKKEKDQVIEFLKDLIKDFEVIEEIEKKWNEWIRERGLRHCLSCGIVNYATKSICVEKCVEWEEYRSRYFGEAESWVYPRDTRVCKKKITECSEVEVCIKCGEAVLKTFYFEKARKLRNRIDDELRFDHAWKVFLRRVCKFDIDDDVSVLNQLRQYVC